MGFSRKKLYPLLPVDDINFLFFLKLTPWTSRQIYRDPPPWNFPFFALTPIFFPKLIVYPLESQRLLLYPPGIFHQYPQQGGYNFFLEKPNAVKSIRAIIIRLKKHQKYNVLFRTRFVS